jgi:hypothetical protein
MTASTNQYSSPIKKLVQFFESSRDSWKGKYMAVKQSCRALEGNVRDLSKSRDKWKQEAKQANKQLEEMRKELEAIKNR